MKIIFVLLTLILGGCTSAYIEAQHISSVRDGSGGPSWSSGRPETEVNAVGIGVRRDYANGIYIDSSLFWQARKLRPSELEGRSPFYRGTIGWTFWEK